MGLFNSIFGDNKSLDRNDDQIVAVVDGRVLPLDKVTDQTFSRELLGETIAIKPSDDIFVSPANGVLEMLFSTKHSYGVRMKNGQTVLVHIGIDTVELKGQGFKAFAKQGDTVKAGQKIISADLYAIKSAGYQTTTMMIVTGVSGGTANEQFVSPGTYVMKGQVINNK